MDYPKNVDEILGLQDAPTASINDNGLFVLINDAFTKAEISKLKKALGGKTG